MKPAEAYEILRNKMEELIVKMNKQAAHDQVMALLEDYINECSCNSHYDQVANVNTMVRRYDNGDVMGFLGPIQHKNTLTHIDSVAAMKSSMGIRK